MLKHNLVRPATMPPFTMPMDAYRHENNLVINFDLPGVDAEAVEVTLESKSLKVVAPRPRPTTEGIQWLTAERPYGTSTCRLPLGDDIDVDGLHAHVANGVLTITLPVIEPASRRIEVTTGGSAPVGSQTESIETPAAA
jgi:HSP20 family protein